MMATAKRWVHRSWFKGIIGLLALALLGSLLPGGTGSSVQAQQDGRERVEIGGTVAFANGTGVAGVRVVAGGRSTRGGRTAVTDAQGNYTLRLPPGRYVLNLEPAEISRESPAWVYTGEPVPVELADASINQNFTVDAASVTVSGRLAAPEGEDFSRLRTAAWVRAENQEGQGNTVRVADDGSFSVHALPGTIMLDATLANPRWRVDTDRDEQIYFAEAGETVQVEPDPVPVVLRGALISGQVSIIVEDVPAPAGIPVRAWRLDNRGAAWTTTDENGTYQLQVSPGVWLVRAMPAELESYGIYDPVGPAMFVPAERPQRVNVRERDSGETQDLRVARVDVLVRGRTVDASGEPLTEGVNGRVYALYDHPETLLPVRSLAAPLREGEFELGLSSTLAESYRIGVYFPPNAGFEALSTVTYTISASNPMSLSIPIAADNSRIQGTLNDITGTVVTGVRGRVWAVSDSGGRAYTRINPEDGSYAMNVTATDLTGRGGSTWWVKAMIDPASGYVLKRPRVQGAFLPYNAGAGATATVPFTVAEVTSVISGRVLLPEANVTRDGIKSGESPLAGIRVVVSNLGGEDYPGFRNWVYTNRNGDYRIAVPAGDYRITAHTRPIRKRNSLQDLIAPAPVQVRVSENERVGAPDLVYRESDAPVSGQVTYNEAGYPALVRARSADGAVVHTRADEQGTYRLNLIGGIGWRVQAAASDDNTFLRSQREVFTPTVASEVQPVGFTLNLSPTGRMPERTVFTFHSDEDQEFSLSDGSQLQIPAGAMGISESVTLLVRPMAELFSDSDAEPIGFGYRLEAFDSDERPITDFFVPVTLVVPFSAADLEALGVTIDDLVPAYWDEPSESWKAVDNVVILPDDAGGGDVHITVDHFTDYAVLAEVSAETQQISAPAYTVYLPRVLR